VDGSYGLDIIAQHFLDVRSETALINSLRKHLAVRTVSPDFKSLIDIPWRRIWTTNYDDAVEQALGNRFHKSATVADDVANAKSASLVVVHINGMLSRLRRSLTPDFVISSEHYATDHFNQSVWATVFRNDVRTAKALFFVGYSLYDLDVARLLYNPELIKSKTIFIDRPGNDPVLASKIRRFGTLHEIGVQGFANRIDSERSRWVKPDVIEQFDYWRRIYATESMKSTSDSDVYDLVLKGDVSTELLAAQSESPEDVRYSVVRECELN
jgi:hypothetical protein